MTYGIDPSRAPDLPAVAEAPGGTQPPEQPAPAGYGAAAPGYGTAAPAYGYSAPVQASAQQTSDLELKPSSDQYRSFLTRAPAGFLALMIVLFIREGVFGLILGVVAGILAIGGVFLYIAVARVRMDALSVTRRGLLGSRTFARADLATVLLAPYQASSMDARRVLMLWALDRQGKRVLRLGSSLWRPVDLELLSRTMGPAPVVHPEVLTPKTLHAVHPGAVSYIERHPFLVGCLIAVGLIVAVVLLVVAFA